jgi:hypothetical protein
LAFEVFYVSVELKTLLDAAVEEDFKRAKAAVEQRLTQFRDLLLKVTEAKALDVVVWFEGTKEPASSQDAADLDLLERVKLVKSEMRYTHPNFYRRFELTSEGAELAGKLAKES